MFIIEVSEIRYGFMEYLKTNNIEYTSNLFLRFLSSSISRIAGIAVEPCTATIPSKLDLIVINITHLDTVVTKWLQLAYLSQLSTSGHTGDYYIINVVGNSGILYHVSENFAIHNTIS